MPTSDVTGQPIHTLFLDDVTRDIPPVIYFHEKQPEKLAAEVSEYIITGGWPAGHPNRQRVERGIHEEYVRRLTNIARELDKPGGPDLPNVWISGFYGSGKSSFAKLLGMALDGVALPDGRSMAAALLARDTSPCSGELHAAWKALRSKLDDPIAVVFDIGAVARDNEHIHSVAVRQIQERLGYSKKNAHVAFGELEVERAGRWAELEALSEKLFGVPWEKLHDEPQVDGRFSNLMAHLYPDIYRNDVAWLMGHGGLAANTLSPEEAITTIRDMLNRRRSGATLFLVVDEVSQYVLADNDRVERLRAFASALGSGLKGRVWLLALGQQKMEQDADASFLVKTKDRFPPQLRVHLDAANIRDVVHKRLLQKKPAVEGALREMFEANRANLKLYAYRCESITPTEFVDIYPMLPEHIDLLLLITSALRARSSRSQGDDQAIRGLLQMLGELFRERKLADQPIGNLITIDQIYEVQQTALDSDVQASMARILSQCAGDEHAVLLIRVAKAVALLELIQDQMPTDAKLVAQCLYDRVDRGNQDAAITEALEDLRRRNLLGYSEKNGYKLQSSSGEEWERDRRDIPVAREAIADLVIESLKYLMGSVDRPRHQGRPFPWSATFSDGRSHDDSDVARSRDEAIVAVDYRFLVKSERLESTWVKQSDELAWKTRLLWLCGDIEPVDACCRELFRSRTMIRRHDARKATLSPARKLLLQQERNRAEDLEAQLWKTVAEAWMSGRMYFQGRSITPADLGATFPIALLTAGNRILPDLYDQFVSTIIQPSELEQLLEKDLSGPSPKFMPGELGIIELDNGRYVPVCSGSVPSRIQRHIEAEAGVGGSTLLAHFGRPPYGYPDNVVKACVAGMLRSGKVKIQTDTNLTLTAIRDAGVREVFTKDRAFKRANIFPGQDDIGFPARARICKFFSRYLQHTMDREDHAIADAVSSLFPAEVRRLREVFERLRQLPGTATAPRALTELQDALERCIASSRQTLPTVQNVNASLDVLRDGMEQLNIYDAELTVAAIQAVRSAVNLQDRHLRQLEAHHTDKKTAPPPEVQEAAQRLRAHLHTAQPWREIQSLDADLTAIKDAYTTTRGRLLLVQEALADQARTRIKTRDGYSVLTGDQSHRVLRPITLACSDTDAETSDPDLLSLDAPFLVRLQRAVDEANTILDELISHKTPIVKVPLGLWGREVKTEADVDAIVNELRERLLEQLKTGAHLRLA